MVSQDGGVEIEKVAHETPERIFKAFVNPALGLQPFQARQLAFSLGLQADQVGKAVKTMMALYQAFVATDSSLLEINPLIVTAAGDLLALLSGMLVGGAIVSLRESRKTDSAWTIFHYFNITGMLLSLPLVLGHWTLPPWASLPALLGVLIFSILGQMGMTIAYRHISTTEGGVISTVGAAVGGAMGLLFLHETATPGFLAGSLLIIVSGIYLTLPRTAWRAVRS